MTEKPSGKRIAALQSRRLEAGRLFEKGATQAQVARELGVTRVSAMRWFYSWNRAGWNCGRVRTVSDESQCSRGAT
jgi:predicted transcriptional regulator